MPSSESFDSLSLAFLSADGVVIHRAMSDFGNVLVKRFFTFSNQAQIIGDAPPVIAHAIVPAHGVLPLAKSNHNHSLAPAATPHKVL